MVPKDDQVPYHSESPPLLIDACFEIIVSSSASGLSKLLGSFIEYVNMITTCSFAL